MSDYTLADLAEDAGQATATAGSTGSSGGGEGGDWMLKLFDRLDEKGIVDQFMAAKVRELNGGDAPAPAPSKNIDPKSGGGSMDAEGVKSMMLQLYDYSDQIPGLSEDPKLSELIKLIDENPQTAQELIAEHMGGGAGE